MQNGEYVPAVDLTHAEIDKGKAGRLSAPKTGRILYWDRTTPGFALMVTHTNARSFVVQYRPVGSRESRRMKLRGKLSLKEARREARDLLNAVAKRADPLAERRAAAAAAKKTEMPGSLRAEVKEYFRLEGPKLRSRKEREAAFDRLVLPELGDKDVPAISRKDIVALLDDIEQERGASMADHVLRYLSRFFNWYASRNEDFRTPIGRGMACLKESERRRQHVLNDAELRAVWQAAEASPCAFNRLVQFILTTATRRNEAARAQRHEIIERENGRVLVIPNERYKTNLTFVVPLSSLACEVLDKVPHIGSKWIFTTDG
jgi:integrase